MLWLASTAQYLNKSLQWQPPMIYSLAVATNLTAAKNTDEGKLAPLQTVYSCDYIIFTDNGWQCLWCNGKFKGKHARRSISHVLEILNTSVAICKAVVLDNYRA